MTLELQKQLALLGYKDIENNSRKENRNTHVYSEDESKVMEALQACIDGRNTKYEVEFRVLDKGSNIRWCLAQGAVQRDADDKTVRFIWTDTDITDLKNAERTLQKANHELKRRIEEQTKELELKNKGVEKLKITIDVLLKGRREDRQKIKDDVLINVKEQIAPYLDQLKKNKLDERQKALLSIIESNMNEIISPFTRKLSLKYLKLTPTEIKVANMIKNGHTTKQIATIMNISTKTVATHRTNIRKKIGLNKKRANLRSHLFSMP